MDLGFSNDKWGRPRKLQTSPLSFENLSEEKEFLGFEDNEDENSTEKGNLVVAGDLDGLEEELRRRTEGMRTEEDLSGFLRCLSGEWGSRKKKRKIVDARNFGDVLPIGWKLLLSIKCDGDRVWLGCSRYIRCYVGFVNYSGLFFSYVPLRLMVPQRWILLLNI